MNRQTARRRISQAGYSLAEVMVAMAILTIVILAALTIYDRSNRMFNQGVQASDMQQSTRVAFDRLVSDIRLTGFDYDRDGIPFGAMAPSWQPNMDYVLGNTVQPSPPNGHVYVCLSGGKSAAAPPAWTTGSKDNVLESTGVKWQEKQVVYYQQPDEQIEYAGESAITIRANFNYNTALGPCPAKPSTARCENGRELADEGDQFPLVTTDNDEIVTYVLKSNSGKAGSNADSVVFYADTDRPRDANPATKKKENKVTISGVDLSGNYPPYTLYRYTLDNNGSPVPTPIADNIRRLTFHYYTDAAGTAEILALPYGEGQYDGANPDATVAQRDTRATVKAIRIDLVGMNPNMDAAYTDAADTAAPHYRKYELDSLVVPRNIGKHGMKEFSTQAPGTPVIKTVCAGTCNSVYVTWDGPPSGGDIDSYNIVYDIGDCAGNMTATTMSCTGCNPGYSIAEDAGSNLEGYATKITPGNVYRFSIQAINKYGSATGTTCIAVNVLNMDKPETPSSLDASGGAGSPYAAVSNGVQLYWDPVTTHNSSNATESCTDGTTKSTPNIVPGENVRYRIRRSKDKDFDPTDPSSNTLVLDENTASQPGVSGTKATWLDTTAPMGSCISYYYRIQAVTVPCCNNGGMNQGGSSLLARSKWFPDPSTPAQAAEGKSVTTAKPDAPGGVGASTVSCSGLCDVKVSWAKVTTSGTNAIFIDSYIVTLEQETVVGSGSWNVVGTQTASNGQLSKTFSGLDPGQSYRFKVVAHDCVDSDPSTPVPWPCTWGGGAYSVTIANFGGTGTQANPFDIQAPAAVTVQTANPIAKIDWVLTEGATVIGSSGAGGVPNPPTTYNFQLPATGDSIPAKLHVTLTSAGASPCQYNVDYWVIDQPPPACALKDQNTDPTVFSVNTAGNYVDVILKNTSADVLKPKAVSILWNTSNSGPAKFASGISSVVFDEAGASPQTVTNASCAAGKYLATTAAADNIAANQQNYVVRVNFAVQSGKNISGNPITNVCVQYQSPFGDIKTCSVAPNSGNCTMTTCP